MLIYDPKATMADAAKQGVKANVEDRQGGRWRGEHFQLVDGVKWYRARMVVTGWEVFEVNYTPT